MSNPQSGLHVIQAGGTTRATQPTPKVITAQSESRNSFARIIIGGIVLGILCIALIVALACRQENVRDILIVLSGGLGYMLGREVSKKGE
jgi:hypothetical protein